MPKDDTLLENFVTVTKRLPLKARFLVGICLIVVVFELISGVVELNEDNEYATGRLRNKRPQDIAKIRERKEISQETIWDFSHGSVSVDRSNEFNAQQKQFVHIHRNPKDNTVSNNNKDIKVKFGDTHGRLSELELKHENKRNSTTTEAPANEQLVV